MTTEKIDSERMGSDLGVRHLASLMAPDAQIVSASNPEPALRRYNVVAIFDDEEASRDAVLRLEKLENDDAAVGLVALGHESRRPGVQPEDTEISGDALGRARNGGLIGAAIGAVIIGLASLAFGDSGVAIGAAAGGALFGAFIGAVWGAFVKFGGSDAYRQSYVENEGGVTLVSLHTADRDEAATARDTLAETSLSRPMLFHRDGERVWSDDSLD